MPSPLDCAHVGLWPGILPNVRGIAKSITYDEVLRHLQWVKERGIMVNWCELVSEVDGGELIEREIKRKGMKAR